MVAEPPGPRQLTVKSFILNLINCLGIGKCTSKCLNGLKKFIFDQDLDQKIGRNGGKTHTHTYTRTLKHTHTHTLKHTHGNLKERFPERNGRKLRIGIFWLEPLTLQLSAPLHSNTQTHFSTVNRSRQPQRSSHHFGNQTQR